MSKHPRTTGQTLRGSTQAWRPGPLTLRAGGFLLAVVLAVAGQSFAAAREAGVTYVVRPGDTLGAIALASGVPLQQLALLNGLPNPDRIRAGQTLVVGDAAPVAAGDTGTYVVQPGETLGGIALRINSRVETLAALNDIGDPHRLRAGQKLRLPAPGPGVDASATSASLSQRVQAETRRIGGTTVRVGLVARNLATGDQVQLRANERFAAASVLKLPILAALEQQAAAGTLQWTPARREQAAAMITRSDNDAANALVGQIGKDAVNATAAAYGLQGTQLVNAFAHSAPNSVTGLNRTTPADMARLLELLVRKQVVNPQASERMRTLLARTTDRSKIARLLPAGTRVENKSGWFDGIANDVGIVSTPAGEQWVIAVFSEGVPDAETGNQLIAAVSRAVYDAWSNR